MLDSRRDAPRRGPSRRRSTSPAYGRRSSVARDPDREACAAHGASSLRGHVARRSSAGAPGVDRRCAGGRRCPADPTSPHRRCSAGRNPRDSDHPGSDHPGSNHCGSTRPVEVRSTLIGTSPTRTSRLWTLRSSPDRTWTDRTSPIRTSMRRGGMNRTYRIRRWTSPGTRRSPASSNRRADRSTSARKRTGGRSTWLTMLGRVGRDTPERQRMVPKTQKTHRRQYPVGAFPDRNPATSYSPRGSLPKYHRR